MKEKEKEKEKWTKGRLEQKTSNHKEDGDPVQRHYCWTYNEKELERKKKN